MAVARIHGREVDIGDGARVGTCSGDGSGCAVIVVVVGDSETGKSLVLCSGPGEINSIVVL